MKRADRLTWFRPTLWLAVALGVVPWARAVDPAGVEFFEKHIRPILIEHCYQCHSAEAEKVKGGLLLDTRDGVLKGGDNGPAIVPGNTEKSLLIKAVRYTDEDLQMPPKGKKLAPGQVADLEAWVKMGAPDPRTGKAQSSKPKAQSSDHWAFKPVKMPAVPVVKNSKWARTPVDNFVLARLEEKKLSPSPAADQRTLIRRATFDLLGLPPTPEEVAAFEADKTPDAFARLVERLLDSPRYGERWGRYWLDVARYADTKGYVFEEERRYPYSYTYRDYVIRAFNEDLPYDQFLIQQIAADLLPLGEDKRALAALGFLTLGRRFLNNTPDIIDDRIDVVCRGTMGLTVACARCHDHKFDPIPTKDYYSLYGVFASSDEPKEKPLLGNAAMPKEFPEYQAEKKKRVAELDKYRQDEADNLLTQIRAHTGDYLLAVRDARRTKASLDTLARERKLRTSIARRVEERYGAWKKEPAFAPWFAYAELPKTNFTAAAAPVAGQLAAEVANPLLKLRFPAAFQPKTMEEVAAVYNALFADVDKEWRELSGRAGAPTVFADASKEALRQLLYAPEAAFYLQAGQLVGSFDTPAQQKVRALQRKIDELDATHPGAPPRAMAMVDNASPHKPRVFKRGNAGNPGEEVPRQFLEIVAGPDRKPFQKGSGRLEMAQAIAGTNNPLTARVFVNRAWMYHFGVPLVRTPSDFGTRADPPTHPELLDYLAARFMADGWSMKKLHRLMMLSSAYQQSSEDNAKAAKADPANELLWRMIRRRLDFESMRDTLLRVAGTIDLAAGGRPVDITTEPFSARRTVYGYVERQNLPGLFRTFDFASPDATSPQRFATTVPQQALFLMNSPFVVQQAKSLLERPEIKSAAGEEQKLQRLYQVAFQRAPDPDELAAARKFLHGTPSAATPPEPPAWQYGWGHFDEATKRVAQFHPLPHFTKYAWQGGTNLPDPKLGWVLLNADGGHPGDARHAAIRRWTAPRDGIVGISGELNHPGETGDGVRSRIVSSRKGELGQWLAQHSKLATKLDRVEVKRGDTLDFVTDCRASENTDGFQWTPVIKFVSETAQAGAEPRAWNAKTDFSGPPKPQPKSFGAWEKYAQVLLLANELVFVD